MKFKAQSTMVYLNELKQDYNELFNTDDKINYLENLRKSLRNYKEAKLTNYQFLSYTKAQNTKFINNTIEALSLMISQITLELYNY